MVKPSRLFAVPVASAPRGFAAPWSPGPPTPPSETYEVHAIAKDIFEPSVPITVAFMNAPIPQTRVLLEYAVWSSLKVSKATRLAGASNKPTRRPGGVKARRLKLRRVRG